MTERTLHTMTVDLPMSALNEREVDISFMWNPVTGSLHFMVAEPAQPFSGPDAERRYDGLQATALDWFERNHERALKQVKSDEEDGL